MDAKSLKKLNRRELLEVMVKISEQNEALEQENQALRSQLENRRLSAREVGSLAQASLEATDLFIAADNAAKVYLENVLRIEKEAQLRASQLLEETLTECITMRAQSGFGPDELIPPDWRLPQEAQAAPAVPGTPAIQPALGPSDELIVSFDSPAAETSVPSAVGTLHEASDAGKDSKTKGAKKEKRGFFSRKKKQ